MSALVEIHAKTREKTSCKRFRWELVFVTKKNVVVRDDWDVYGVDKPRVWIT